MNFWSEMTGMIKPLSPSIALALVVRVVVSADVAVLDWEEVAVSCMKFNARSVLGNNNVVAEVEAAFETD